MSKLSRSILIGLLVLALSGFLVSAAEVMVEPEGSLQDAVNSAEAGDTVMVKPGTYNVNLKIEKSITLKSSGAVEETVLKPEDPAKDIITAESPEEEPAIKNVVIDGFTVQSGDKSGIVLTGSNHRIVNNIVKDVANHGIIPIGGNKVVISGNDVMNCRKSGIFIWGTKEVVITRNHLEDNKTGVVLTEGATGAMIHFNNVVKSWQFAVESKGPEADATFNWWGEGVDPAKWVTEKVWVSPALNGPVAEGSPVFMEN